jgi:branched-chain amino acid transport system substrate-binding protein
MHVNEPVLRILDASPTLPPGSQAIIDKAMAKDRDKRYSTTAELAADLNQLVQPQLTFRPSQQRPKPPTEAPPVQKTAVSPLAETQIETPEEMKRPPIPASDAPTEQTTIEPPSAAKGRSQNILLVGGIVILCLLFLVGAAILGPQLVASLTEEPTPTSRPTPTERPQEQPTSQPTDIVEMSTETAETAEPTPDSGIPVTCLDALGCFEIGPGQPFQIAALQLLSGSSAFLGEDQRRAIELAVDEWGEIEGHPVEVRPFDDGCSDRQGRRSALQIVGSSAIVGVIGTSCTNAAIAAMPLLSESGFSMISGSNTSPELTAVNGQPGPYYYPGYFRVSNNDLVTGQATALFAIQELGLRRAATFSGGDPYSQQVVNLFNDQFIQLGGEIVHTTDVIVDDPESVRNELAVAAVGGAEIIFFPFFEVGGLHVVNEARSITGLNNTVLLGGDGLLSASFVTNVGSNGVGMLFVGPAVPTGPTYDDFVGRYQERYGEPPISSFHSFAYDATNILLQAIADVVQVGEDGTLLIGRQRLRNRINNTTGYDGLTGPLSCDQYGDCGAWWIDYYRLDDPAAGLEGLLRNVVFEYREGR